MDDRNNQLIILGHACKFALKCFALKRFALKCFALKCKHHIGLTPLYWPQVGRRTGAMSVHLSVGGESDGEGHCRTADGRQTEVFTSF